MATGEHTKILKRGVDAWNRWRVENPSIKPDIDGADLRGAHLSGAFFYDANLRVVKMTGADLSKALLDDASLT
ncbi:MAG TPA: pentapeptide repeat-containing protein [Candidatus Angelobacter sp.]|nr:pentapeptide repeat-containing protein [Candidatus Angelobacter sp.]